MQVNAYNAAVSNRAAQGDLNSNVKANANSDISKASKETIEDLKSMGGKGITQAYFMEFSAQSIQISFGNSQAQGGILDSLNGMNPAVASSILAKIDFASIGYTGKSPLSMNTEELNALISKDGYFGVENTANRIADFVINGAGDNLEKLKSGFEGMKKGFADAEKIWGGKLPDMSQETMAMAIEKVSKRIEELGGNAIDVQA